MRVCERERLPQSHRIAGVGLVPRERRSAGTVYGGSCSRAPKLGADQAPHRASRSIEAVVRTRAALHRRCSACHVTGRWCRDQPGCPGCGRDGESADCASPCGATYNAGSPAGPAAARVADSHDATSAARNSESSHQARAYRWGQVFAVIPNPAVGIGSISPPDSRPDDRTRHLYGTSHGDRAGCCG